MVIPKEVLIRVFSNDIPENTSQDNLPDEVLDKILAYYSSELPNDSPYLYLDKKFKQTEDLDFTHLTGLKIVKAEKDKDITIETTNEKAPFYNNGKGITPIGHYNPKSLGSSLFTSQGDANLALAQFFFKGDYDGDNHIIDGLIFANGKSIELPLNNITTVHSVMPFLLCDRGNLKHFFIN